ncbi:flagellar filament capping protein FliD [Porticoccus sp. GXU_MW_L64]
MITSAGVGSGLELESLINQLVTAERTPVESRLVSRQSALTIELSAFGNFQGSLSSLQNSLNDLNQAASFGQRNTTSSDEDIVSVSATSAAAAANYSISVTQLASAHSLASASYDSLTDAVGEGTLTFRFGTTDYVAPDPGPESYNGFAINQDRDVATITIDDTNNTLEGVRDAINSADIGVGASIVNDGTGFRLLLSSSDTGAENSLQISVSDVGDGNNTDAAGLSALAFNGSATNLTQTVAAQDALFTLNGLSVSSSSNVASEVIEGVELTLNDITSTSPVTVSVSEDRGAVRTLITDFVDNYNNFVNAANTLTAFNAETQVAGPLQGDFAARSVIAQVRQAITAAVEGFDGPFSSLSEIGLTTQTDGTLSINSSRLDTALEENFDDIVGLFAAAGFPSDNSVEFAASSDATQIGSYAVTVTQLATQGQLVGAASSFPLDIDADNDALTIVVNGITSNQILLTQGNYTSGADLAAELQARINGDSALSEAGARVSVSYNGSGFEITSATYGSESTVEITAVDTNTLAELGLDVATGSAGVDVVGTINGIAATGTGQLLSAANGDDAEGIQLVIADGALGSRGTVNFSRGVADRLNTLIEGLLDPQGILGVRSDGIQDRLDDIDEEREALDRRIETIEARLRRQFTALDGLLAQLQQTSTFLEQQLANIPRAGTLVRGNNN